MTDMGQKCSFRAITLLMCWVGTFVNQKDLLGQCKAFLKVWGPKVKVSKWSYMEAYLHFNVPCSIFCQLKTLITSMLSICDNLRPKGQGPHMVKYGQNSRSEVKIIVTRCPNMLKYCFGNVVWIWCRLQRRFLKASVWLWYTCTCIWLNCKPRHPIDASASNSFQLT